MKRVQNQISSIREYKVVTSEDMFASEYRFSLEDLIYGDDNSELTYGIKECIDSVLDLQIGQAKIIKSRCEAYNIIIMRTF